MRKFTPAGLHRSEIKIRIWRPARIRGRGRQRPLGGIRMFRPEFVVALRDHGVAGDLLLIVGNEAFSLLFILGGGGVVSLRCQGCRLVTLAA